MEDIDRTLMNTKAEEKPIQLSEEDRLMAENLQLRLMNIVLQAQSAAQELERLREKQTQAQRDLMDHRDKVSKKYGIDFEKFDVQAGSGLVVPRGSTPPGLIR